MDLIAQLSLTAEELTALREAAGKRGETLPELLDRCFQAAVEREIKEAAQYGQQNKGQREG